LAEIVPACVEIGELWGEDSPDPLWPDESAALDARCVDRRRLEFACGRTCARRAMRRLGLEPRPVLRGPSREPVWPDGLVGSITHCDGYAAAAVGWRFEVRSIGIDAEVMRPLPADVRRLVVVPAEADWLSRVGPPWDVVLFSAKESIFKAWFPLAGTWLGFDEAEVEMDPAQGRFLARLRPTTQPNADVPRQINGRFVMSGSHVITCSTF
jgi:4'-phosphopantetheinyl transferase EntD